jgi:Ca-activated chloride channel family protein
MKAIITAAAIMAQLLVGTIVAGPKSNVASTDPMQTPRTPGELQIVTKDGKPAGACPLKHTDVDAQISGFFARVNVTQEFYNPTEDNIEAIYTFPLPDDSAVDRMEMKVGSRTITGKIYKREEAKEVYEAAKQAGHVAGLLDQERPNIFTQSVANIMPGEKVIIKISYTQVLKYEAGKYDFVFPMVVGPRYIPGEPSGKEGTGWAEDTDEVPDASRITPPVTPEGTRAGHDISVSVDIDAGIPVYSAKCLSHDVDCDFPNRNSVKVTLKDKQTIPNKDFVLSYSVAGADVQSGIITSAPNGKGGFFTLIMQPPASPKPKNITPKEMIFVIDTSGSQMGEPLAKSKETMLQCIRNVNPGDTFNMISFSNGVRQLFDTPQPYTRENEEASLDYLKECEAGGGTEMMPAIKAALEPDSDPERLRIVVFFTDGYIGNDFQIIDYIQKNLGDARIFSFGIGSGVNRFLIEKMAAEGRGASEVVLLNSNSEEVAKKFYDRIRNPLLTDITIDWNGLPIASDEVYPKRIPDLFSAQPLVLNGRYTGGASGDIIVHAKVNGKPWTKKLHVTLPKSEPENDSLLSIWARAKVDDLSSRDWLGAQTGKVDASIKDQIVDLALEYNLMTQYTSFVAVEETVTADGKPKTVVVPVEMPEGVSYEGVFGNAAYAGSPCVLGRCVKMIPQTVGVSLTESRQLVACDAGKADSSKIEVTKLDKSLLSLIDDYNKLGISGVKPIPGKLKVKDGCVEVEIEVKSVPKDALDQLKKLGLKQPKWTKKNKTITGWAPIEKLTDIAKIEFVTQISPPAYSK